MRFLSEAKPSAVARRLSFGANRLSESFSLLSFLGVSATFRQAATIEQSAHVYSQIGLEYGKSRQYAEALDALATAVRLDPNFAMAYYTRGNVYEAQGNKAQAAVEYRHALAIDPNLQLARDSLVRIGQ